jgi:hypothetical protein
MGSLPAARAIVKAGGAAAAFPLSALPSRRLHCTLPPAHREDPSTPSADVRMTERATRR